MKAPLIPRPVRNFADVEKNIQAYQAAVVGKSADERKLAQRMSMAQCWHGIRADGGAWIFAPSKFAGYAGSSARDYIRQSGGGGGRHGTESENALRPWFSQVEPATALGKEMTAALHALAKAAGGKLRAKFALFQPKPESREGLNSRPNLHHGAQLLLDRISSDAEICSGRPCIRGTRMRVSDIVEMMAHGAGREEILGDYPYLADADLSAALAYAAMASAHRLIRAA